MNKLIKAFKGLFGRKEEVVEQPVEVVAAIADPEGNIIAKFMNNGDLHIKGDVIAFSKAFENE
jgi:hypothetical protein